MKKVEKIFARVCKKYGIKNRQFTKAEFYRICEGEHIFLLNTEDFRPLHENYKKAGGFYVKYRNEHFIYIRSFFEKNFSRFTAFHELGHYLCGHLEGFQKNALLKDSKKEAEADYFAFLATGLKRRKKPKR
jgi:Zn-dependent peptidase ImmA (M78 family)